MTTTHSDRLEIVRRAEREYVNRIRNAPKKAYANALLTAFMGGEALDAEPRVTLSAMGAQAVRLRLADYGVRDAAPAQTTQPTTSDEHDATSATYDTRAPQRRPDARPVLFPNVSSWHDLFPTFARDKSAAPPERVVRFKDYRRRSAEMRIGGYLLVDGAGVRESMWVGAYDVVSDAVLANTIWIEWETMSWRIFVYPDGKALVTCEHSRILGNVWVAMIDASTIPLASRAAATGIPAAEEVQS